MAPRHPTRTVCSGDGGKKRGQVSKQWSSCHRSAAARSADGRVPPDVSYTGQTRGVEDGGEGRAESDGRLWNQVSDRLEGD